MEAANAELAEKLTDAEKNNAGLTEMVAALQTQQAELQQKIAGQETTSPRKRRRFRSLSLMSSPPARPSAWEELVDAVHSQLRELKPRLEVSALDGVKQLYFHLVQSCVRDDVSKLWREFLDRGERNKWYCLRIVLLYKHGYLDPDAIPTGLCVEKHCRSSRKCLQVELEEQDGEPRLACRYEALGGMLPHEPITEEPKAKE